MKNRILLIICSVMLACAVAGCGAAKSEPSVGAHASKKSIYIGDRIMYTVDIRGGNGLEVELPKFGDYVIGDFEIKDSGSSVKDGIFGARSINSWYSITSYLVGKRAIPEIEVKYRYKPDKNWYSKKTKPIDISVESVLKNERSLTDIRDIKGPLSFPPPVMLMVTVFLFLAIVLAALAVRYFRMLNAPIPKLPHETAMEELEAIAAFFARTGDFKGYYVQVSDCVRRYIERVFMLKAPEMTTEEFLNSLKDSQSLSPDDKDLLKQFMNACDLVKFAKYKPTGEEIASVLSSARKFIGKTRSDNAHI